MTIVKKKVIRFFSFFMLVSFLCIGIGIINNNQIEGTNSLDVAESEQLEKEVKTSASFVVNQIHILNDNWSVGGFPWIQDNAGTPGDPHVIENVTMDNGGMGPCILIENCVENFIIRSCTITNTGGQCIQLDNVDNGLIRNNSMSTAHHGILGQDVDHCRIKNNTMLTLTGSGICFTTGADNCSIEQNHIEDCQQSGINITSSNNITIFDNTLVAIMMGMDSSGIFLNDNTNSTDIIGNEIHGCRYGISIRQSCYNTFMEDNHIYNSQTTGISILDCQYNAILNNNVSNNNEGIFIEGSTRSTIIQDNYIADNTNAGVNITSISFPVPDAFYIVDNILWGNSDGTEETQVDKDGGFYLESNNVIGNVVDNDGDGLSDYLEFTQYGTNRLMYDTDGDNLNDGFEILLNTNPLLKDTDGDGDIDSAEYYGGSNPLDPNSILGGDDDIPSSWDSEPLYIGLVGAAIGAGSSIVVFLTSNGLSNRRKRKQPRGDIQMGEKEKVDFKPFKIPEGATTLPEHATIPKYKDPLDPRREFEKPPKYEPRGVSPSPIPEPEEKKPDGPFIPHGPMTMPESTTVPGKHSGLKPNDLPYKIPGKKDPVPKTTPEIPKKPETKPKSKPKPKKKQ